MVDNDEERGVLRRPLPGQFHNHGPPEVRDMRQESCSDSHTLGVQLAQDKLVGPSPCLTFLGIDQGRDSAPPS